MGMTRTSLKKWLEDNAIPYSRLCREASVGHYILHRWLTQPEAGISTRTIAKLEAALFRLTNNDK